MSLQPVVFISHGAPTFALDPGVLGPALTALGATLDQARAVLVVSPHWQTTGVEVQGAAAPATIHDFGGFDPMLYTLSYPAQGHPELAARVATLLSAAGLPTRVDPVRGFDHGAWVPLRHLRPQADLPLIQVSMPRHLDAAGAVALGRALAPLRAQGVVIVGSGSLTHNLWEIQPPQSPPAAYAREFAQWVGQRVLAGDLESLAGYRTRAPHAERAHPTDEHYLPLVVAAAAARPGETVALVPGGILYGVLSMDSFVWGQPAAA
jgi:4,5-DOPA dioxygenase extradiol